MAVRFSKDQVLTAVSGRCKQSGSRASYEAVCTDTRTLAPSCLFVALQGERYDAHDYLQEAVAKGAAGAVVKAGHKLPPVPRDLGLFEVEDTLMALGGLARFHRQRFKIPIGAVTGSNGKTTTKEMVAAILATRGPALKTEGNFNNEVGVPLTLFGLDSTHKSGIVEMGMNHPGEIARLTEVTQPDAGAITSIAPAHLKGLGSIEGVAAAKGELFLNLRSTAIAVVNVDEPLIVEQARRTHANRLSFGRSEGADVRIVDVASRGSQGLRVTLQYEGAVHAVDLKFVGAHNALNAAAAFALGCALGHTADECVQGLAAARPYERRLNVLAAPGKTTVLDDTYNANPASMAAALVTLTDLACDGRPIAVLGDMLELGDNEASEHRRLGKLAAEHARVAAFFGPLSAQAYGAAESMGDNAAHFTNAGTLVEWLKPRLREGDVVLVKGSRGMRLERVVEALTGQQAPAGGH